MAIYGYCRISRNTQNIERQERNILEYEPTAIIVKEIFTGRVVQARPQWQKLYSKLKGGDVLLFDSVSRMSRDASDGVKLYLDLFDKGITLVFLKEPHINSETYRQALQNGIESVGDDIADIFISATNQVLKLLAKRQIELAFAQAEKEVSDLRQRTKEGIETARLNGKQIGGVQGRKLHTKKSEQIKPMILKYSRDFGGALTDNECMKLLNISRNTYYNYKKQLRDSLSNDTDPQKENRPTADDQTNEN